MTKHKFKLGLQIFLLIMSVFAVSYIIKEAQSNIPEVVNNKIGLKYLLFFIIKGVVKLIFSEKSLVSALEASDLNKGIATCPKGKDGSLCQEYPSSECSLKCATECLPSGRRRGTP